jgi:hypothetical protein
MVSASLDTVGHYSWVLFMVLHHILPDNQMNEGIVEPNQCLRCGNRVLKFEQCNYSTFNPGSATCTKCGQKVKVSDCDSLRPEEGLTRAWNVANPPPEKAIADMDKRIQSLKEEKCRLKKLFKI